MNLKYYDLAEGMTVDNMHSVLLGVTRQYTEIILTSVNSDFYVGSPDKLFLIYESNIIADIYIKNSSKFKRKENVESFRMAFMANIVLIDMFKRSTTI